MLGLPLAFTVPLALGALVLLPALYYLLRVTPPRPRRSRFPPLRLILDAEPREETPARTPPWLLLLRLAIAALDHPGHGGADLEPAARDARPARGRCWCCSTTALRRRRPGTRASPARPSG